MTNTTPMTVAGAEQLRAELQELKTVARPRVIAAIAEARAHGDLKENAEYHAAREQQSFIEGRIAEVETKLAHAQIIDVTTLPVSDKVIFGATVRLIEEDSEEEKRYKIVGEDEASIKEGKISFGSPIARALIGKFIGDVVDVHTPGGIKTYEIVDVQYL
ncbi:MAG TPA: transcription elongation factor GreA [Candidatus Competibacteraceae bacterium]|nr:MAG: transcription elongation factor GreA [Candidatus Competibacteraceae bacterium]HOB62567.1 transcription elongation factor GreA [Candidatus Competibacteraceae bacterium]HQA27525.1 transcription elongation factor GreA [Candidatus Competibacteraceae bacterium]HQD55809.1 transcription elongation factor GreA [Candidatus Competibacteraceae bacterium]